MIVNINWSELYPDYDERMKAMSVQCFWHIWHMELDSREIYGELQLVPKE